MDSTESASASPADKAAPLVLLQEFSLQALMVRFIRWAFFFLWVALFHLVYHIYVCQERYFVEKAAALESFLMPTLSDALRAEAVDPSARVYAVRPHPAHPNLFAVLSSVGIVLVSVGRTPVSYWR